MSDSLARRIPGRMMPLALLCLVAVWIAGAGGLAAEPQDEGEGPILARAYKVHHRSLTDAAELVEPLLSEEGSLSLRPRLKTLVVEDRASVLDKVGPLLESFDLPPHAVEVTLTLFIGKDLSEGESGRLALPGDVSFEVLDVMEKIQKISKWKSYELLGSRSVSGVEGGRVTATLSDEYRIVLEIGAVDETRSKVTFKTLSVQKVIPTAAGGVRYEDVYTVAMVSPLGRLKLVGAASGPDSHQALFLSLRAELR